MKTQKGKNNSTKQTQQKTVQTVQFTLLDIVGISLSTLLFTLVWVGVFSVFLPERSELVLSEGLRNLASSSESTSPQEVIDTNIKLFQSSVYKTSVSVLTTTLSVVQTGGSMKKVVDVTGLHAREVFCTVSTCQSTYHQTVSQLPQVLRPITQKVLGSTAEYLNTVTFGLLSAADPTLYSKVTPARVVYKNSSVS